mmetsp:Transcript_42212/g.100605  ORF Transcript_42212/g.100605 Transcript_42212/m.100605 type:complete len:545 (-) Transcript_42212:3392-5026(-)
MAGHPDDVNLDAKQPQLNLQRLKERHVEDEAPVALPGINRRLTVNRNDCPSRHTSLPETLKTKSQAIELGLVGGLVLALESRSEGPPSFNGNGGSSNLVESGAVGAKQQRPTRSPPSSKVSSEVLQQLSSIEDRGSGRSLGHSNSKEPLRQSRSRRPTNGRERGELRAPPEQVRPARLLEPTSTLRHSIQAITLGLVPATATMTKAKLTTEGTAHSKALAMTPKGAQGVIGDRRQPTTAGQSRLGAMEVPVNPLAPGEGVTAMPVLNPLTQDIQAILSTAKTPEAALSIDPGDDTAVLLDLPPELREDVPDEEEVGRPSTKSNVKRGSLLPSSGDGRHSSDFTKRGPSPRENRVAVVADDFQGQGASLVTGAGRPNPADHVLPQSHGLVSREATKGSSPRPQRSNQRPKKQPPALHRLGDDRSQAESLPRLVSREACQRSLATNVEAHRQAQHLENGGELVAKSSRHARGPCAGGRSRHTALGAVAGKAHGTVKGAAEPTSHASIRLRLQEQVAVVDERHRAHTRKLLESQSPSQHDGRSEERT